MDPINIKQVEIDDKVTILKPNNEIYWNLLICSESFKMVKNHIISTQELKVIEQEMIILNIVNLG